MSTITYLANKYSENNFILFCSKLLKNIQPKGKYIDILSQYQGYIKECKFLADFKDSNNKKIAIMAAKITDDSNARTTQRNFVAHVLSNGELFGYDGALVAYYDECRTNWKLALVTIDYDLTDKGIKVSFQPAKRFSFLVGEGEPFKTYNEQLKPLYDAPTPPTYDMLKEAFSISKVTKDFYSDYCDCFNELVKYLIDCLPFQLEASRLQYEEVKEFAITFAKKTLGQIVFLHFIQKKGWLGVPLNAEWGEGDKNYIFNTTRNYSGDSYFNEILEPLFYNALNKKRENDEYKGIKIPFLNGGLFSPVQDYDWKKTNFNIPNSIWFNENKTGFLDILSQYNFTVDESDPTEQDIAVDPEMLGKIFESLLDPEERHNKGAHYTPREIVHFMCIESIAYNVSINCNIDFNTIKNYILYGNSLHEKQLIIDNAKELDEYVSNLKIVDPAVGSGAFLVGMLNEIVRLRLNLSELLNVKTDKYTIKKLAIRNSLFGVDIENDAIEIAKLRLWLSLIVDQQVEKSHSPKPLPNLVFQLRVGNSLVDEYQGVKLWDSKMFKKKGKVSYQGYDLFNVMDYDAILQNLKKAKEIYFSITDEAEKRRLFEDINRYQLELIKNVLWNKGEYKVVDELVEMQKKRTKPFFIWELEFDKVFDDGGFDIVIANPPYIQLQLNEGRLANELEPQGYETFTRMGDIYCIFYEQAMNLLKKKGVSCFITSNKWMRAGYGEKLRGYLASKTNPLLLVDFGGTKVFESATVDVNVLVYSKEMNKYSTKTCLFNSESTNELSVFVEHNYSFESFENDEIWTINSPIEARIKSKVEAKGIKLKDWKILISYGIKTGFNEAFIIDEPTMKSIIKSDAKAAEIIRPILRGRDISRYEYMCPNLYMICTFPSKHYNIDDYPEVKNHLLSFKIQKLEQTGKSYIVDGVVVKARKKTNNKWFETQDSISYSDEFFKQKIVYPCIMSSGPSFALDNNKNFLPAPGNIITGNNLEYLLGILCSKTYYFALRKFYMGGGIEGELKTNRLLMLPVPKYEDNPYAHVIESCVKKINLNIDIDFNSNIIEETIKDMLNLTDDEFNYILGTIY